jgi:hypothetical protein
MNYFRKKSYKRKLNPLRGKAKNKKVILPYSDDSDDNYDSNCQGPIDEQGEDVQDEGMDEDEQGEVSVWDAEQTMMKEALKSKGFLTYCLNGIAGERSAEDASSIMYRVARILARSYYAKTGRALQAVDIFEWVEALITKEYSLLQETFVFFYKDDNKEAATLVCYLINFTFFLEWYTYMYCSREGKQVSE